MYGGTSRVAATEWGANGGANIWTNAHDGPIAGISTAANWLWSDDNFTSTTPGNAAFRTGITVLSEPGTFGLLAIGLAGFAWTRRRKIT